MGPGGPLRDIVFYLQKALTQRCGVSANVRLPLCATSDEINNLLNILIPYNLQQTNTERPDLNATLKGNREITTFEARYGFSKKISVLQ